MKKLIITKIELEKIKEQSRKDGYFHALKMIQTAPFMYKDILKRLTLVLILILPVIANATTRTMSACSSAAWDTAYSAASSGDTIAFPAGSCSVSMTKNIAKTNLIILGQGSSSTTVTGGFTCTSPTCNGLRITAMKIVGGPALDLFGSSDASGIRVDHCIFYNGTFFFEFVPNISNSVIDHNTFDTITGSGNYIWGSIPRSNPGFPYTLGAASNGAGIYYEDNTITNSGNMAHFNSISRGGGRAVFRYNKFTTLFQWDPIDAHDNYEGTSESGAATWEIYNNVFDWTSAGLANDPHRLIHLRGGQGVVFNNYTNGSQGISFNSYVLCENTCTKGTSGICSWVIQDAYVWDNKQGCSDTSTCDPHNMGACCSGGSAWNAEADCSGGGSNQQLVENTDFFNSSMPGYSPYTYPHPLVSGETSTALSGASRGATGHGGARGR